MKLAHLEELVYGRGVSIEAAPPDPSAETWAQRVSIRFIVPFPNVALTKLVPSSCLSMAHKSWHPDLWRGW
jgi:hypothetical protein